MKTYRAPWSRFLILVSTFATLFLVGISVLTWVKSPHAWIVWLILTPTVVGCALFTVRGYMLTDKDLYIKRLLWNTRIPLTGLRDVKSIPNAMQRSIRLFGNGGLYSFTGLFRNSQLGSYRAFVTDPKSTVVLWLPKRVVVLSPGEPDRFARDVAEQAGLVIGSGGTS